MIFRSGGRAGKCRTRFPIRRDRALSRSDADCQAFLVSQMRLNDELAKALDALERRKLLNLLWPLFHPAPRAHHQHTP